MEEDVFAKNLKDSKSKSDELVVIDPLDLEQLHQNIVYETTN